MHLLAQDLRYGARLLGKSPAFTVIALLTLALGTGATTAIFSIVDAVLLKPLPFRDPQNLLVIYEKSPAQKLRKMFVAPLNYLVWSQANRLSQIAAFQDLQVNLTGGPNGPINVEEIKAEKVSATLFPLLGVDAIVGRCFRPEEDRPGPPAVALLGHSLWQRRFASDPDIAGKTIRVGSSSLTVIGVLPPGFAILEPGVEIFLPLGLNSGDSRAAGQRYLTVIARQRGTIDQVRYQLEHLGDQMEKALPALDRGWRPSVFGLQDELVGDVGQALWILLGAVGFLLLMACVNVANLLLSRGAARRKELALRAALGATRARIVWQLLTESMLLSVGGGLLGLLLAAGIVRLLARLGPATLPRLAGATIDFRVFAFALAASLLAGILSGAAPALHGAGASLSAALNEGGRGGTTARSGRRLRDTLVATEIALAVVILTGAGLLIRSFVTLRAIDPGFRPGGVLVARIPLGGGRNTALDRRAAFLQQVTERAAALPGVRAAGAVNTLPLDGLGIGSRFSVDGRPAPPPGQRPLAIYRSVTPAYFRAVGIPLIAGREFAATDGAATNLVAIINQTLARRFWPNGSPLGGHIVLELNANKVVEIVGVVGDTKPDRIDAEDRPTIYSPYPQAPFATMTLALRTSAPPLSLAPALLQQVRLLDPDQPVSQIRPLEDLTDRAVSGQRFNTTLLAIFAAIAFLLAAVGIYGVISYDVTQRTHEIGIRTALGASSAQIRDLILRQGALLAVYGIVAGLLAAGALTRLMKTMLFGVDSFDLTTFAIVALLLAAVALVAAWIPARRAMALDPAAALRDE